MNRKLAWVWLDYFYFDADMDILFLQQLIGAMTVGMDEDEHGFSKPLNKTVLQRKNDTLRLVKYLVIELGDFKVLNASNNENDFEEFSEKMENIYQSNNNIFNKGVDMGFSLEKLHKGKPAPLESEIPDEIIALFQPVNPLSLEDKT